MSEEEKKAIETLEIEGTENNYLEVRTLLNLVEKQQKEIEELKDINKKLKARKYMFNAITGEVKAIPIDNNYISKDKIRKFIKDELPDDEIMECCGTYDVNGVRLREELEELLEEN